MIKKPTNTKELREFLQDQTHGIKLLYEGKLFMPTLMLVYATLDIISFVRAGGADNEAGARFRNFVKDYLESNLGGITGYDLWGARCALLHTATAESTSSKKGIAREIWYSWGKADKGLLDRLIQKKKGQNKYVAVSIEILLEALGKGIDSFLKDLEDNPTLCEDCMKRVAKILVNVPTPH
jgi:hypothetical protein